MNLSGTTMRPIWLDEDNKTVKIIDQRLLPHRLVILDLRTPEDVIMAIREMCVRGAPLIGVTAAFGVYLAVLNSTGSDDVDLINACERIKSARPTAVNLSWAVEQMMPLILESNNLEQRINRVHQAAKGLAEFEAENCRRIGQHGLKLIQDVSQRKYGAPVNILTHCNAGWLACIEYGTATAPMYAAHDAGIPIHIWVDETRPLNQGSRLTAWELGRYGIKHTVITDNAGGHLMQHGLVDMVIVGTDRTTFTGDVANKIGTYLKALAAKDNQIPFYVALPSSTFDWTISDGIKDIPIEQRDANEIKYVQGLLGTELKTVLVPPQDSPAADFAFDVTPARLITGFITERGICGASEDEIQRLFPEKKHNSPKQANTTALEIKVISAIQGDIPITERPYQEIAQNIGLEEQELIAVLKDLDQRGLIRRFGATLRHQKSGYKANAMVAWLVEENRIDEAGQIMSACAQVSHCYARISAENWQYNLYTMIHAEQEADCHRITQELSEKTGISRYTILFSREELKKTSMQYFSEDDD